jgi:hypothetical protein
VKPRLAIYNFFIYTKTTEEIHMNSKPTTAYRISANDITADFVQSLKRKYQNRCLVVMPETEYTKMAARGNAIASETMLLAEASLAEEWNPPEEDTAWADL